MSYSTLRVRPAGFFSRSIAFIIDLIIISTTFTLAGFLAAEVISFFGLDKVIQVILGNHVQVAVLTRIIITFASFMYGMLYFAFFWSLVGFTPGKFLLGLRILRIDGKKISFWRAFARALCYYLSGIIFLFGFFWVIFDKRRQALHDKIVKTLVIYT